MRTVSIPVNTEDESWFTTLHGLIHFFRLWSTSSVSWAQVANTSLWPSWTLWMWFSTDSHLAHITYPSPSGVEAAIQYKWLVRLLFHLVMSWHFLKFWCFCYMPHIIIVGCLWKVLSYPLLDLKMAICNDDANLQVMFLKPSHSKLKSSVLPGITVLHLITLNKLNIHNNAMFLVDGAAGPVLGTVSRRVCSAISTEDKWLPSFLCHPDVIPLMLFPYSSHRREQNRRLVGGKCPLVMLGTPIHSRTLKTLAARAPENSW